jgi:hypothetical protein
MYERRGHQPIPRAAFFWRVTRHAACAIAVVCGTLAAGMIGYRVTEHFSWIDAFLNAAMLLGGMGPVNPPVTDGGKLFAGVYALFCGMAILVVAGVILAPIVHRVLHRFHWEGE